jgi:hypothetical protein
MLGRVTGGTVVKEGALRLERLFPRFHNFGRRAPLYARIAPD